MYGVFTVTFRVDTPCQKSKEFRQEVWRPIEDVGYTGYINADVRDDILAEAWSRVRGGAEQWAEYVSNVCPVGCHIDCTTGRLL